MDLDKMTESSWNDEGEIGNGMREAEITFKTEISMDASLPDEEGAGAETDKTTEQVTEPVIGQETEPEDDSPKDYLEKQSEIFKNISDDNLDLETLYRTEYKDKGEYSEDTYKALEAKGWTKEHVNTVSEAIAIKEEYFYDKVIDAAGGAEEFLALQEWSKTNAPKTDIDRYNQAVQNGDLAYIRLQMNAWKSTYTQTNGAKPRATLQGTMTNTSPRGAKSFDSLEEQTKAINDPRFSNAGKYRNEVLERMISSNFKY